MSRRARLPPEREDHFQDRKVIPLFELYKWLVYHTHDSRRSAAGFLDLACLNIERRHLLFAELKREGEHPTPEQQKWLDGLSQVEIVTSHLWYPHDWNEIEEIARGT